MRSAIVAEPPLARQHFFRIVCGCPKGLLEAENFGKLFLSFSRNREHEFETRLPPGSLAASRRGFAFYVADPIGSAHEFALNGLIRRSFVAIDSIRVWFFRTQR